MSTCVQAFAVLVQVLVTLSSTSASRLLLFWFLFSFLSLYGIRHPKWPLEKQYSVHRHRVFQRLVVLHGDVTEASERSGVFVLSPADADYLATHKRLLDR